MQVLSRRLTLQAWMLSQAFQAHFSHKVKRTDDLWNLWDNFSKLPGVVLDPLRQKKSKSVQFKLPPRLNSTTVSTFFHRVSLPSTNFHPSNSNLPTSKGVYRSEIYLSFLNYGVKKPDHVQCLRHLTPAIKDFPTFIQKAFNYIPLPFSNT